MMVQIMIRTKFKNVSNIKLEILIEFNCILNKLDGLTEFEKVKTLNKLQRLIKRHSPFADEPVSCIQWISTEQIEANDYNPNIVAPPEMKLLERSINMDGYTQPIVAFKNNNNYEVVDGFHRNRVGRECESVRNRVKGYLPLAIINKKSEDRDNRIAATIRHNRARGKHTISGMSDIVLELKNRNWTNERIAKNLGMDEDEILRLCQITGLAGLFKDQEFSKSWDIEDSEPDFEPLSDDIGVTEDDKFRTINTNDKNRIFHTYDKWECHKAGLYETTKDGMTAIECEEAYKDFLSDSNHFTKALHHIIIEWKYSCEHYLTNSGMNRIAWLGQAAMCYATGIPAKFRAGFNLLSDVQQKEANQVALKYLNKWLLTHNREEVTMEIALSDKQMELY